MKEEKLYVNNTRLKTYLKTNVYNSLTGHIYLIMEQKQ